MIQVGVFEKVSLEQFAKDVIYCTRNAEEIYQDIKIPTRATVGSAGYDFSSPVPFILAPGESIKIPTGIRVRIDEPGWMLAIFPRSSLGFKYRMQLDNTVGIVDSDYYNSQNEGHIFIKITNDGTHPFAISAGDRFAQGIFIPFGITNDDETSTERVGGMGSTGA